MRTEGHILGNFLRTNLLIEQVLFQKPTVSQLLEKFPALYGTPSSMYKIPPLVYILSQMNVVVIVRLSFIGSISTLFSHITQIDKLLLMQNSTVSFNVCSLRNKYSRQHLVLKSLNLCFPLRVKDQVSHPLK
jgi:hypothetical protein